MLGNNRRLCECTDHVCEIRPIERKGQITANYAALECNESVECCSDLTYGHSYGTHRAYAAFDVFSLASKLDRIIGHVLDVVGAGQSLEAIAPDLQIEQAREKVGRCAETAVATQLTQGSLQVEPQYLYTILINVDCEA